MGIQLADVASSRARSATLTARVMGVTREALAPFVDPGQLQRIEGSVDASISAAADGFSLDAVRGSVALDEASIDLAGVPFRQSVPTRIGFDLSLIHI